MTSENKIKAVIFDLDGVLVKIPVWPIHNEVLSKHNINVTDKQIPKYLGRPVMNQIELIENDYQIKLDKDDYLEEFTDLQNKYIDDLKKSDKLINLMEELIDNNFKVGVATSSNKDRAIRILTNLGIIKYLQVLITAEQVKKHKPHPDVFLEAIKNLKLKPSECLVIEDALNGIEAANKAGTKTIGLVGKYHSKSDFKSADLTINSLDEINPNLIKKLK